MHVCETHSPVMSCLVSSGTEIWQLNVREWLNVMGHGQQEISHQAPMDGGICWVASAKFAGRLLSSWEEMTVGNG